MVEAKWLIRFSPLNNGDFISGIEMTDPDEVLPCPFCGGRAYMQYDVRYPNDKPIQAYEIYCSNEDCIMFMQDRNYYRSRKKAIKAWNGFREEK